MVVRRASLALLLASLGCSGLDLHFELGKGKPLPIKLVAVYPVALRFAAPAYRSYELAMDEVEATLATGNFMVLGPSEFRILDPESDALFSATALAGNLHPLGLYPGNVAGLRGWIERREARGSQQLFDVAGKPKGQSKNAAVTYILHEELIAPDTTELVAEAWTEVPVDPFADHPPWDDVPEVRAALKKLVARLFQEATPRLRVETMVKALPFEWDAVPWDEEALSLPGRPSLQQQLLGRDAVTLDASRLLRLSYVAPELSPERQAAILKLPAGLLVRNVPDSISSQGGPQRDDLLVEVEGERVAGPQTPLRWLSIKAPGTFVQIKVQRGGGLVPLHLVSPDR